MQNVECIFVAAESRVWFPEVPVFFQETGEFYCMTAKNTDPLVSGMPMKWWTITYDKVYFHEDPKERFQVEAIEIFVWVRWKL